MKGFKRLANTEFVFQSFDKVKDTSVYQGEKALIDFGSSAYLGLSFDITEEDVNLAKSWGLRNHWSRISGNNGITRELESELEVRTGFHSVRLAQSISLINLTILKSIGRMFGQVIVDEDAHITMKLGIESHVKKENLSFFENNNIKSLKQSLESGESLRPRLIVIDGVYSMKGNKAHIHELLELCHQFDSYLYIDDAHGFGVLGNNGLGVIDGLDQRDLERIIYVGSFSKCASNPVAFIGVNKELGVQIDHYAPCLIYSGPPSNFHVAISLRHLKQFNTEKFQTKRKLLNEMSKEMHLFCSENNFKTLSTSEFPLLALSIDENKLEEIIRILKEDGIFAKPAIYPVVRRGDEIIRFTFTAINTAEEIEKLKESILRISQWLVPGGSQ